MIADILEQIELFSSLDAGAKAQLAQISSLHRYAKESILYYEAETQNRLLFLVDGLLKVYKIDKYDNEIFLYYVYKNDMISELSSLETGSIHCFSNAEFVQNSQILSIDFEAFTQILRHNPLLSFAFSKKLIARNHQLQCVLNRELVFDATAKVAFMLYNDLEMFNDLKRNEAAFMLHLQPETLSRVLKRLSRNGVISVEKGMIVITDKPRLHEIFMDIG
jgi:CRP/FNR family transcriptional regulator